MKLSNSLYNKLKFLAQILLPALGTLYFTLAGIWDLPKAEEVVGTIVAVDAFLGVVLQMSSRAYANSDDRFDGTIVTEETEAGVMHTLELDSDPEKIAEKDEVLFKVADIGASPVTALSQRRRGHQNR